MTDAKCARACEREREREREREDKSSIKEYNEYDY